jgi:hypothetical protein
LVGGQIGLWYFFLFRDGYQATKSVAADISLLHKMITEKTQSVMEVLPQTGTSY